MMETNASSLQRNTPVGPPSGCSEPARFGAKPCPRSEAVPVKVTGSRGRPACWAGLVTSFVFVVLPVTPEAEPAVAPQ